MKRKTKPERTGNKIMKTFQLIPTNGRKSFGGKCVVIETEGHKYLDSYNTRVATITNVGTLVLTRDENHLSNTTLVHINTFLEFYGFPKMTKKEILNH